jgi:nucleoid-associated protein YgaU
MHQSPKYRHKWLNATVAGVVALICGALLGGFVLGATASTHLDRGVPLVVTHTVIVNHTRTVYLPNPANVGPVPGLGGQSHPTTFPGLGGTHHRTSHAATASYTVRSGDTLWGIAGHVYHDPLKWRHLYQLNTSVIGSNPNIIHTGEVLRT